MPSKSVHMENDFQSTSVKLEVLIEVYRAINYCGFTEREKFLQISIQCVRIH